MGDLTTQGPLPGLPSRRVRSRSRLPSPQPSIVPSSSPSRSPVLQHSISSDEEIGFNGNDNQEEQTLLNEPPRAQCFKGDQTLRAKGLFAVQHLDLLITGMTLSDHKPSQMSSENRSQRYCRCGRRTTRACICDDRPRCRTCHLWHLVKPSYQASMLQSEAALAEAVSGLNEEEDQ
jgi:hypothetical protein